MSNDHYHRAGTKRYRRWYAGIRHRNEYLRRIELAYGGVSDVGRAVCFARLSEDYLQINDVMVIALAARISGGAA